ncbi:MAG: NAD(P)-binding protein [Synechococcus sp. ELA057]
MSRRVEALVVVGAGVSACALAARLRQQGWRGSMTLVEAGRSVGGRSASRRSRRHPGAHLDHGAPRFGLNPDQPPALLQPLLRSGRLVPFRKQDLGERLLDGEHQLLEDPGPFSQDGDPHRGATAMEDLCLGLLDLAEQACLPTGPAAGAPPLQRIHGRRVQTLEGGGSEPWRLLDGEGVLLSEGAWLVLSGTLLAHPRCLPLLGCHEIPLAAANRHLRDPQLSRALEAIAAQGHDPRLALLFWIGEPAASRWQALPFRQLCLTEAARQRWGLERIVIQPQASKAGMIGVVAHARPDALQHAWGSQPGETPDEQALISQLRAALLAALEPWVGSGDLPDPQECQLMRWGGAFPLPPGLNPTAMICPESHLALCGDAITGPGFGRISGAWHSGEWLAQRLLPLLSSPNP